MAMYMCTKDEDSSTKIQLSLMQQEVQKQEKSTSTMKQEGVIEILPLAFLTSEKGTQVTACETISTPSSPKSHHEYIVHHLFKAIYETRLSDVRHALRYVDIQSRNEEGKTVLIAAVLANPPTRRVGIMRLLIASGASLHAKDSRHGRDVIAWAASAGVKAPLNFLLELLDGEVDFHATDDDGAIYLHHAVTSGQMSVVELVLGWMLRLQIPVDVPNRLGLTPYILARKLGFASIAELLRTEGDASPQKYDELTFRSPREWSIMGRRERSRKPQSQPRQDNLLRLQELSEAPDSAPKPDRVIRASPEPVRPISGGGTRKLQLNRVFALWSEQRLPSWREPSNPKKAEVAPTGKSRHRLAVNKKYSRFAR